MNCLLNSVCSSDMVQETVQTSLSSSILVQSMINDEKRASLAPLPNLTNDPMPSIQELDIVDCTKMFEECSEDDLSTDRNKVSDGSRYKVSDGSDTDDRSQGSTESEVIPPKTVVDLKRKACGCQHDNL